VLGADPGAVPPPHPIGRFLGVLAVEGPDRPLPFGGRVQVLSVERYDSRVTVTWRLAPRPDPVEEHHLAMAALDRDTTGLSDEHRLLRRVELAKQLVSPGRQVQLIDDVGTRYRSQGGGGHGGRDAWIGRTDFVPAIPASATQLTVQWGDLEFPVRCS